MILEIYHKSVNFLLVNAGLAMVMISILEKNLKIIKKVIFYNMLRGSNDIKIVKSFFCY